MDNFGGIKELYDVTLRLNQPIKIGTRQFEINEAILSLKTAEIAQVNERIKDVTAHGGYHDNPLVNWQIDQETSFAITHGILSPTSWALLSNSQMKNPRIKSVNYSEDLKTIEDDVYCYIELKYKPNAHGDVIGAQENPNFEPHEMGRRQELMLKPLPPSKEKWIFCYNLETGCPIKDFEIYENKVFFKKSYKEIMVDYTFDYEDKIKVIEVGNRLFEGFLRLDAKMSFKDEESGEVSTVLLELPKIKLSSSLSMRLGKNYDSSIVSDFQFTAYPSEDVRKDKTYVSKITFLETELSGDYL